jgi:acetyltransferase-like isoleucine patch superfamily enzyme
MNMNPRFAFWDLWAKHLPNYGVCSLRAQFYRFAGCDLAPKVTIQGALVLLGCGPAAARLHIDEGSIVAPMVTFGVDSDVRIGRNVSVGPQTAFYTATHAVGFASRRMQLATEAYPIVVEDGVWIGAHCLILAGVTVGRGSIVAAGSVIATSVPANSLVEGNPASVRDSLPFTNR